MSPIAGLTASYLSGETSPVDEAERFLAASPVTGEIDAFISVDPEAVRAQAQDSARRITDGSPRGPLEGVLVGIKDFLHVAGYATRAGTDWLVEEPTEDSLVVRRLRDAGAIIAGKTRMTELGLSPLGLNPSDRCPRNPHDLSRPPGGSSSGSAAAVAAGLVPLAVGSDGGGSLRTPPALSGVLGLKPTYGAVRNGGQLHDGWWSLDTTGPIARSAEDLALAFALMRGVQPEPLEEGDARVGVDWRWWGVPTSDVDRVCRQALGALDPVEVSIDHLDLAQPAAYVTTLVEVAAGVDLHIRDGLARFGPDVQLQLVTAAALSGVDYVRSQQVRTLLAESFAKAFREVDVLVTPMTACTAPALPASAFEDGMVDEALIRQITAYAFPANLIGAPAVAVPIGTDAQALPISLQLMGRHGEEGRLLALARGLERRGLVSCPPPVRWYGGGPAATASRSQG